VGRIRGPRVSYKMLKYVRGPRQDRARVVYLLGRSFHEVRARDGPRHTLVLLFGVLVLSASPARGRRCRFLPLLGALAAGAIGVIAVGLVLAGLSLVFRRGQSMMIESRVVSAVLIPVLRRRIPARPVAGRVAPRCAGAWPMTYWLEASRRRARGCFRVLAAARTACPPARLAGALVVARGLRVASRSG
jgi:hypothetical protein